MRGGRGGDVVVEWARVAPGKILVAASDRAWLHRPSGFGDTAFSLPMGPDVPGSPATTKNLLDAAVGAGQRAAAEEAQREREQREQREEGEERKDQARGHDQGALRQSVMTPLRWVWRLAGYYRTTHATPPLMTEASRRFAAMGIEPLARWAEQKAVEERGHDELALRDIRALGYNAEAVVRALAPKTSVALVDYFTAAVLGDNPIGSVGYSYALERLALTRGRGYIESIQALLPRGVDATRCLRVHSAAGSDAGHVEETINAVARLQAPLRTQIALATYETTALCYLAAAEDLIAEDTLKNVLATCASDAALTLGERQ